MSTEHIERALQDLREKYAEIEYEQELVSNAISSLEYLLTDRYGRATACEDNGLSQLATDILSYGGGTRRLAEETGVSHSTLMRIVDNETSRPHQNTVKKIAKVLGVEVERYV